ncbi:MAG TPA: BON domain-containing protein [Thermoleophilaceae bacterium]|nr:BON domain-containing protein [Thermoleophilaceae bacterium]
MSKLMKGAPGIAGAAIGALATWFLDPQNGKLRRHVLRDRTLAKLRRGAASADRHARYAAGHAQGAAHAMRPGASSDGGELNDAALARKVESEIFRGEDAPKGSVNVNAENGVIYLRGEVKHAEHVESLAAAARKVNGVKGVKNLLHPPATPAPMKE